MCSTLPFPYRGMERNFLASSQTIGLRRRSPFPVPFVLCMDKLSRLIEDRVRKEWQPIKVACSGPTASHLHFADDVVLFASATEVQARTIADTIQEFCHLSRRLVNKNKNRFLVVLYVQRSTKDAIRKNLHISLTTDLGKYLGVPIAWGRKKKATFQHILDKINKRLLGWKNKLLNAGGRAMLVKSTRKIIPLYFMQTC